MSLPESTTSGRSAESSLRSRYCADAPRALARLRVGERPPAGAVALREEHAARRGLRPVIEPLGELGG